MATFAVAALVIDVGLARVAQNQLQTAVDGAALAGLTSDDAGSHRVEARRIVETMFPGTGDVAVAPVLTLTGGSGELDASQTIVVDRPNDQALSLAENYDASEPLTLGQEESGDLISGRFDPATIDPTVNVIPANRLEGFDSTGTPDPARPYRRTLNDLTPDGSGASGPIAAQPRALLVRMRRTESPLTQQAPVTDRIPDKATTGRAIPLLFGHGAFIHGSDPSDPDVYSPTRDGIRVRGTAIAFTRSALSVGFANGATGTVGATTFAVSASALSPSPEIQLDPLNSLFNVAHVDSTVSNGARVDPAVTIRMVGARIMSTGTAVPTVHEDGLVAVYKDFPAPDDHVIVGFARGRFDPATGKLTLAPSAVSQNASATLPPLIVGYDSSGRPVGGTSLRLLQPSTASSILTPPSELAPYAVLAPALVR